MTDIIWTSYVTKNNETKENTNKNLKYLVGNDSSGNYYTIQGSFSINENETISKLTLKNSNIDFVNDYNTRFLYVVLSKNSSDKEKYYTEISNAEKTSHISFTSYEQQISPFWWQTISKLEYSIEMTSIPLEPNVTYYITYVAAGDKEPIFDFKNYPSSSYDFEDGSNYCTVKYIINSELYLEQTVLKNSSITIQHPPEKIQYRFDNFWIGSWENGGESILLYPNDSINIEDNLEIIPQLKNTKLTIDPNGGTYFTYIANNGELIFQESDEIFEQVNIPFEEYYYIPISLNKSEPSFANGEGYLITTPKRNGYRFEGWVITTENNENKIIIQQDLNNDSFYCLDNQSNKISQTEITVQAQWTKANKITFNGNGGNIENIYFPPQFVDEKILMPVLNTQDYNNWQFLKNAYWSGYFLKGYFDRSNGGNLIYDANGKYVKGTYWDENGTWIYNNDITAYAQWEKILSRCFIYSEENGEKKWIQITPYYYNGSNWEQVIPYYYDGTNWQQL